MSNGLTFTAGGEVGFQVPTVDNLMTLCCSHSLLNEKSQFVRTIVTNNDDIILKSNGKFIIRFTNYPTFN
jgi:hypothetical protein